MEEDSLKREFKLRNSICGLIMALLMVTVLPLASIIQPVKAAGDTVYIRANGSVDPSSAPILNVGNVSYKFTAEINGSLVVERDNIVVDGSGYMLLGTGSGNGISLDGRSNVTIKGITIEAFEYGIYLSSSAGNTLYANTITNSTYDGIRMSSATSNSISASTMTNNDEAGICLYYSSGNSISANTITNNSDYGIWVYDYSNSNSVFANNVTNNNYYGIKMDSSYGNSISANNITNNGHYGIRLEFSSSNSICANNVTNNGYSGTIAEFYSGILFYSSNNNNVSSNNVANNKIDGIYTDVSSGNGISANNVVNNRYGIELRTCSCSSVFANNVANNSYCGIHFWMSSSNNSVCANNVTNNKYYGILLEPSSDNNSICANNITNNPEGILLTSSSYNRISANNITNNTYGIELYDASNNNAISTNNIANGTRGIYLYDSAGNFICHNNLMGNTAQATSSPLGYVNTWDNGYPSGGNYWSDYTGVDLYRGPYQNASGSDGIGDTAYVIDANNTDHYPLMATWNPTLSVEGVTAWYWTSNTTINSVVVGDVDGDGQKETVTGGTFYDGTRNVAQLVVWNSFSLTPERLTTWYWVDNTTINSIAIGDVNGDGQSEIVTGGYYFDGARQVAQLVVWNGSSLAVETVKTWYWTGDTVINSVALGDVDADGQVEIVTGGYYNDGARNVAQLVVWNGSDLSVDRLTTWYWTGNTVINSVAVGDVDADGQVEVVTGGTFNDGARDVAQLVVWTGASLTVKRLTTWYWTGNTVINSVAVGDVDADGQIEIVTAGYFNDGARNVAQLVVWTGSALIVDRLTSWYWTGNTVINSVALGEVDGDGQVDVVTGGYYNDGTRNIAQMVTWGGSSLAVENVRTWYWFNDTTINSLCLSDINGDLSAETVTGGAYNDGSRLIAQLVVWGMRQTV
jgi:parallel beta-helix repeat protein